MSNILIDWSGDVVYTRKKATLFSLFSNFHINLLSTSLELHKQTCHLIFKQRQKRSDLIVSNVLHRTHALHIHVHAIAIIVPMSS